MVWSQRGVLPMSAFWYTWRREIIRGAVLFVGVIAAGLFVRHMVARVRTGVAAHLPVVLRDLGDLKALENLQGHMDMGSHEGSRTTAETWTHHAQVAPGQWVWIRNTNGSLKVEGSTGDSVIVTAVKSYRRSDPATVRIETVTSKEGVAICALWTSGSGGCAPGGRFKPSSLRGNDVAVDFTVRLPRRVRLGATTVNGAVRIAGVSAPLAVATVNGEVDVETSAGPVSAVSVNGSVRALMQSFGDTGEVSVFTVNGSATAELPAQLDAEVEATTVNGSIRTDYPLATSGKVGKRLRGTLGAGGRKVHITTVNGSITVLKAARRDSGSAPPRRGRTGPRSAS